MNKSILQIALLGAIAVPGMARADVITNIPITPTPMVPPSNTATAPVGSGSWLASQGVLSIDDLTKMLGTSFSAADRERLGKVLDARNAAIIDANTKLSAQLNDILREGDTQIAGRVEKTATDAKEADRLERMKRLQPSRYQEMMRRKTAADKAAAAKVATPSDAPK